MLEKNKIRGLSEKLLNKSVRSKNQTLKNVGVESKNKRQKKADRKQAENFTSISAKKSKRKCTDEHTYEIGKLNYVIFRI